MLQYLCISRVTGARGKFGELESLNRVARGRLLLHFFVRTSRRASITLILKNAKHGPLLNSRTKKITNETLELTFSKLFSNSKGKKAC